MKHPRFNWLKARVLIFSYRFFSLLDVLLASKFELNVSYKDGTGKRRTNFWKKEIIDVIGYIVTPEEIRKGNRFKCQGKECQVDTIYETTCEMVGLNTYLAVIGEELRPIKLMADHFIQYGFGYLDDWWTIGGVDYYASYDPKSESYWFYKWGKREDRKEIKFLHQLQNTFEDTANAGFLLTVRDELKKHSLDDVDTIEFTEDQNRFIDGLISNDDTSIDHVTSALQWSLDACIHIEDKYGVDAWNVGLHGLPITIYQAADNHPIMDETYVLGEDAEGASYIVQWLQGDTLRTCYDENCEHEDHGNDQGECRSIKEGYYEMLEQVDNSNGWEYYRKEREIVRWMEIPKSTNK